MRALLSMTSPTMLNASEFTLTIALVVFVMLTAILLLIILLLCVSKSFRAFFFREAAKKKKAAEKKKQAAAQASSQPLSVPADKPVVQETAAVEAPAQKTITRERPSRITANTESETAARRPRTPRKKEPDIFDGVLTVPLDGLSPAPVKPAAQGKRSAAVYGNTFDDVPTVVIPRTTPPSDESRKNTYITHSITITRARATGDQNVVTTTGRRRAAAAQPSTEKPIAAKKQTPASSSDKPAKKR